MMKLLAGIYLLFNLSQSLAFAPQPRAFLGLSPPVTGNLVLFERPDASAAISHALEMSKKFGPTSKEAALAWDIVEEMDASDNRFVFVSVISLCKLGLVAIWIFCVMQS